MTFQTGVRKPRTAKATKLPGIPKPPADVSSGLRQYLTSVTEALEVRLGRKGDPRDAAVTFRDLIESGIAVEIYYGGGSGGGISNPGNPDGPDGPGVPGIEDPTAPTNFNGSGAMYNISLWWNAARYEYGGHSYTEVWRAGPIKDENGDLVEGQVPTLNDAIQIGISVGTNYVDPVGSGATFYYWIRHVNVEEVKGPYAPADGVGLELTTSPDVELLLELLDGLIGEDQLTQDLQDQIDLIDELEGFTGYYESWRVDGDLVQRINAISSSSDGNQIIIEELSQVVDGLEGQYTVKIQTNTAGGGKYVSGFGLASSPVNGTPTSRFIVSADQFAVIEPATYNLSDGQALNNNTLDPYTPFQILTRDTEYDGIAIPKGVYIKQAYIGKANVLELIAGSVVADYMESTVAMSAPNIFGGTINIGSVVKPTSSPRDWYVTGSQRVGNFSVDALGIMHAYAAKLYGITIYDDDGTVLLDSGGMGTSTGGNMLVNGELIHPLTITANPSVTGGAFVDATGASLKGWTRGSNWNTSSSFYAGENQCFQMYSNSEIRSDYIPIMPPADGDSGLYLTTDVRRNASGGTFYFRVAYYGADKGFLGSQFINGSTANAWGNGIDEYPGRVATRATYSTMFDSYKNLAAYYARVIVDVNSISGYLNVHSVYLSYSPVQISSSYATTYIKSLYVNQLTGDVNTITAFDGVVFKTIGPSSAGYREIFTTICEQNEVAAIDHEATISGVFSAQYRTDTAYVKLEWRKRNSRSQTSNSWSGWSEVNTLKHKTSEGGSSWTTLPFAGGVGTRYNTDVQFRVSVYMRNDTDNGTTGASRSSNVTYSGTTIGVV